MGLLLALLVLIAPAVPSRAETLDEKAPFILTMPDQSSPRATIEALRSNGDIALHDFLTEGPTWPPRPALFRMAATLDTSELPVGQRILATALAATRLKAVLDRLPPERLEAAPDAATVERERIVRWTVPGTPITLILINSGPMAGRFQFSPETVARAGELYDAAKKLPAPLGPFERVVDAWAYSPGPLIPHHLIEHLPAPLRRPLGSQAVWQWLGLGLLLAIAMGAMVRVMAWGIRRDRHQTRAVRRFGQPVAALSVTLLNVAIIVLSVSALKIWGGTLAAIIMMGQTLAYAAAAWLVIALLRRTGDVIVQMRHLRGSSIDTHLIRVVTTLLGIGVAVAAVFLIADLYGVPIGPLLAGLGIGGLAIALAIRPTLENVIGGLTLFADRPIRVGEFCHLGNDSGTIEEIGLRTTKVRRLDDTLVTIPNAELAQIRINNVTRRRRFLFNPTLGLRYETTAAQLKRIQDDILAMLLAHPKVLDEGVRIRFGSFGDYALNLVVFAYVDETRLADFVAVQEDLNLRIMEIVQAAGTGFAFPSQTHYITQDTPPAAA
ncbi:MAG: mechanosensitive ion channel family protein [Acetobacteraceae bacterium]